MAKKQEQREGAFSPDDEHIKRRRQEEQHAPPSRLEDVPSRDENGEIEEEEPDRIGS